MDTMFDSIISPWKFDVVHPGEIQQHCRAAPIIEAEKVANSTGNKFTNHKKQQS